MLNVPAPTFPEIRTAVIFRMFGNRGFAAVPLGARLRHFERSVGDCSQLPEIHPRLFPPRSRRESASLNPTQPLTISPTIPRTASFITLTATRCPMFMRLFCCRMVRLSTAHGPFCRGSKRRDRILLSARYGAVHRFFGLLSITVAAIPSSRDSNSCSATPASAGPISVKPSFRLRFILPAPPIPV